MRMGLLDFPELEQLIRIPQEAAVLFARPALIVGLEKNKRYMPTTSLTDASAAPK